MNRPPMTRPALLPGLRPMWRDAHTVQLGTDPEHAVVLELPHRSAARLLELLDGSRTERALLDEMTRLGMRPDDVHAVLAALAEAGLVVPAHALMPAALPAYRRERLADEAAALALRRAETAGTPARVLQRRSRARVIVAGAGRLAGLVGTALLDAGVGKVGLVAAPGDAAVVTGTGPERPKDGIPRATAGSGAAGRRPPASGPTSRPGPPTAMLRATDATFLVQVGYAVAARGTRRRVPHLALGVRDGIAVVGPLVPATGGPCLRCLDLHRTDRDPGWPALAAQLAAGSGADPCSAATRLTAAGFAAAEVLAHLDGAEPTTVGTTVEINGVRPWRRRTWTPHPACDCTRRR
ncbi:hypothetical protein [Catellatospora sp. NPDC049609]|uniref:hypothetical protein n=1 Tax=Catellatospora sp. NPDC049609 TaxID=3155505 RepID=UPI00343D3C87